jgi:hypothetical protein
MLKFPDRSSSCETASLSSARRLPLARPLRTEQRLTPHSVDADIVLEATADGIRQGAHRNNAIATRGWGGHTGDAQEGDRDIFEPVHFTDCSSFRLWHLRATSSQVSHAGTSRENLCDQPSDLPSANIPRAIANHRLPEPKVGLRTLLLAQGDFGMPFPQQPTRRSGLLRGNSTSSCRRVKQPCRSMKITT